MVRIRLSEVDDAVRAFLAPAQRGETIVVEDDNGTLQCGVTPYVQASTGEKQAALAALDSLQQRAAQTMARFGVTEAEVDQELQE